MLHGEGVFKGLALLPGCCLFLKNEKRTDLGQEFSIWVVLGRHRAKKYLQNLMVLKDFKQSLHGCRELREAGMGWQADGLNKWLTEDNVSKISWCNRRGHQVNPAQMTWVMVNIQVINGFSSTIWFKAKSHHTLLTLISFRITLVSGIKVLINNQACDGNNKKSAGEDMRSCCISTSGRHWPIVPTIPSVWM